MTSIVKTTDLKPVSFLDTNTNSNVGIDLIIKLLKDSIENSQPVTKEKIIECYLDFTFYGNKEKVLRRGFNWSMHNTHEIYISREEMKKKQWYCESNSIRWFKNKLGEAILKGRLIAIPVIDF